MSAPELKPVKGMVVLKFLEDDDEDSSADAAGVYTSTVDMHEKTCLAQVVAAGPATNVKKGQIVLTRSYARQNPEIDDDTVICDSYCILAVVATTA